METTGKIHEIEVAENILFDYSQSLDVLPEHTHLHPSCFLDTSKRFTWLTFSCLSYITLCPEFKARPVLPDCSVEVDWLKCVTPQMSVTLLVI